MKCVGVRSCRHFLICYCWTIGLDRLRLWWRWRGGSHTHFWRADGRLIASHRVRCSSRVPWLGRKWVSFHFPVTTVTMWWSAMAGRKPQTPSRPVVGGLAVKGRNNDIARYFLLSVDHLQKCWRKYIIYQDDLIFLGLYFKQKKIIPLFQRKINPNIPGFQDTTIPIPRSQNPNIPRTKNPRNPWSQNPCIAISRDPKISKS